MPPKLTAVLAALAIEASSDEFAVVESFLGGSFSELAEIRRNPVAKIDAVDLTGQEIRDWLSELPIGNRAELQVAWIADRLGARMSFETFAANVDDLWFPAMDDVVSVVHSGSNLMVLVLDHEELITLSRANPSEDSGQVHGSRTSLPPALVPVRSSRFPHTTATTGISTAARPSPG